MGRLFTKLTILTILSFTIVVVSFSTILPIKVNAAPVDPTSDICNNLVDPNNQPSVCQKSTKQDPVTGKDGIVTVVAQTAVYITGAASVIMIIIGGIKYLLSAGDSNSTASAKNTILYALVGLVVAVFAQLIVTLVLSKI